MYLEKLTLTNFKGFEKQEIEFHGESTVIFGAEGTGKSAILSAISFLCWNWLNRLSPAMGTDFRSLNESFIHTGADSLEISAALTLGEIPVELRKGYIKAQPDRPGRVQQNKKLYDQFVRQWLFLYEKKDASLPVFLHYGRDRGVPVLSLRTRDSHGLSKWTALERAAADSWDFQTFFEWFRNQEDYEAETIRDLQNLEYRDPMLTCVKVAVQSILPDITDIQVRRGTLQLVVVKDGQEVSVQQLSEDEICTLALVGDIARRMALANQKESNPLEGKGIVLIDDIERNLQVQRQSRILPVLKKTFPNIQWIITSNSPQVLEALHGEFQVFCRELNENHSITVTRMDSPGGIAEQK